MNTEQAQAAIQNAIREIVPDADFTDLDPSESVRQYFELDSLDFLAYVESLTKQTGAAITEDDYPSLSTMDDAVAFILSHASEPAR